MRQPDYERGRHGDSQASGVRHTIIQGDALRIPLADRSVQMTLGSPPYTDARTYDDGTLPDGHTVSRGTAEWIDWMLAVTREALRVTDGPVLWVIGCPTRDRNYQPAAEGLAYRWWAEGGSMYRPCYWHRVGIPGSGGDQWFRADVEYVMAFKRPGPLAWAEPTAMGHPPRWAPGGVMSNRLSDGARVNQWGKSWDSAASQRIGEKTTFRANGKQRPSHIQKWGNGGKMPETRNGDPNKARQSIEGTYYAEPVLANPGNLIKTNTGGGQLGSDLAHTNEAPFPESLCEHFIKSLCPPGGTVLDVFGGSGTTGAAAVNHGRNAILMDLRGSQTALMRERLARTVRPLTYRSDRVDDSPLFTQAGDAA